MAKSLDIIDPKRDISDDSDEEKQEKPGNDEFNMREKRSGGGVFYLVLGIIAILVATGAALYILFMNDSGKNDTSDIAKTASTQATSTQGAGESVTASVPANPSPESSFKYTNEKIRIANGNGISGEANRIKTILEEKDYQIESTGNASRSYTESIVYYKTGQEKLAEAIKSDLSDKYSFTTELADSVVGSYDAVAVLGSK